MSTEYNLMRAILEDPENDEPRLRYASWLEGSEREDYRARGAFIRVQCAIASYLKHNPYVQYPPRTLGECETALLQKYGRDWVSEAQPNSFPVERFAFHRGMIEELSCEVHELLRSWRNIDQTRLPLLNRLRLEQLGDTFPISFKDLPLLSNIRWLNLEKCSLKDADMETIASSPFLSSLRSLYIGFDDSAIIDKGWFREEGWLLGPGSAFFLTHSEHLANLECLWLRITDIGDEGASFVASSPHLSHLQHLDLSSNEITQDGVSSILAAGFAEQLVSLGLRDNPLGPEGAHLISQSPHLRTLRVLHLGRTCLCDSGAKHLARFTRLPNVEALYLERNQIGNDGVSAIATSDSLTSLLTLDLGVNQVDGEAASRLVSSLNLNRLQALYLHQNQLGDEGVARLAAAFSLPRLDHLGLFCTEIHDLGAKSLASSPKLSRLRALDLYGNCITSDGADALLRSPYLHNTQIYLDASRLEKEVRLQLEERNAKLRWIQ